MSWSVSYDSRENFEKDVRAHSSAVDSTEAVEQLNSARHVANEIMNSGAVGAKDGDYLVNLHGHANPEHRPRTGYANDCVGVNVAQKAT